MEPRRQDDRLRLDPGRLVAGLAPPDRRRRGPPADEAPGRRLRADLVARRGTRSPSPPRSIPARPPRRPPRSTRRRARRRRKVKVYDKLMIRHWDEWDDGKRSHLFVADVDDRQGEGPDARSSTSTPPLPRSAARPTTPCRPTARSWPSPPSRSKDTAWSTNTDIWIVSVDGSEPQNLTDDNPGADAQPAYSPDGDYLAYVSQARAGFEADHWVLKVRDRDDRRDDRRHRADSTARSSRSPGAARARSRSRSTGTVRDLFVVLDDAGSVDDPRARHPGRRRRPRLRQRAAPGDRGRRQQLGPGPPGRRRPRLRPRRPATPRTRSTRRSPTARA